MIGIGHGARKKTQSGLLFVLGICCLVFETSGCRIARPFCGLAQPLPAEDYREVEQWAGQPAAAAIGEPVGLPPEHESFWSSPQPLDTYLRRALEQNPAIHSARYQLQAANARMVQAGSLDDPMLTVQGWPFFPYVPQTAAGLMTAELMVAQQVPWKGKLKARTAMVSEEVQAARAQLAVAELETIERVKHAYYELQSIQRTIRTIEQDRQALMELVRVATARYEVNQATQQEVLRLQTELSNVDMELARFNQELAAARAEMARLLHVSPETPFIVDETVAPLSAPQQIDHLYAQAIAVRPELQAQLAEIQRGRYAVELARLNYYPDPQFQVGWAEMTTRRALSPVADGLDMITVGMTINLPVYRARLEGAVREAEASVVAAARQYDALRDNTLQEVKRLFAQATAQQEMIGLLRESILPKTEQAYQVSVRGYQVGQVPFADLLSVWRDLLRYHVMLIRLETQFQQTLASLERVVGGLSAEPAVPAPTAELSSGDAP